MADLLEVTFQVIRRGRRSYASDATMRFRREDVDTLAPIVEEIMTVFPEEWLADLFAGGWITDLSGEYWSWTGANDELPNLEDIDFEEAASLTISVDGDAIILDSHTGKDITYCFAIQPEDRVRDVILRCGGDPLVDTLATRRMGGSRVDQADMTMAEVFPDIQNFNMMEYFIPNRAFFRGAFGDEQAGGNEEQEEE